MNLQIIKYNRLRCFIFSLLIIFHIQMARANTIIAAPSSGATRALFAGDLIRGIMTTRTEENVIYSPASIQACLALGFLGAAGHTADELRKGLHLGVASKEMIANNFKNFLNSIQLEKSAKIQMANAIYVNQNAGKLQTEYERISTEYFGTKTKQINFGDSLAAASEINKWVSENTNDKIHKIINANTLSDEISAILVNAIYFKGNWELPFSVAMTQKSKFTLSSGKQVAVEMMSTEDNFRYANLIDLDATAVELPYENSKITMLIILPKKIDGLKELEQKLSTKSLNEIASKLQDNYAIVSIPKFRIELELDLKQTLAELGMGTMFTNKANFTDLFASGTNQRVSDVRHKAFLDVNEAGSEAAASTFVKLVPMMLNLDQKYFTADHPFMFAIRNDDAVFFTGHVAKF